MKFLLEHKLPRRLRYAKVFFQAGPTSLLFSLDGANADWHASIGRKSAVEMTDKEYARFRAEIPATELLDDDGQEVIIRNAAGYDELWKKPRWVLEGTHRTRAVESKGDCPTTS
ncbi:MAG: hypothetical protein JRM99_04070 [Nitrososphaerota archaeon]|nr:hypothetical protein [Nitrososphaerota archaeon]MDG6990579.1 hypothetical protein [Nitrososphaerota archaeon]